MGWDYQQTNATTETVIRRELEAGGSTVTHYHAHAGAVYLAVREPDGTTTAVVVLVERSGRGLGLKYMHETEGPCYYAAPPELLDQLTPTDIGYAPRWRAKCRGSLPAAVA
jgi:hypothetical protein